MLQNTPAPATAPLLQVDNLSLRFRARAGIHHALSQVSFSVAKGEVVGVVGESGCGKSVTAMAIMRLLPRHSVEIPHGSITLAGVDLLRASERHMQDIRGNRIGMIFQDPMTSLNPTHKVGAQIAEAVRRHRHCSRHDAHVRALQMLDLVRIPDAANRIDAYPHELSGGMRQRVMIAMALACDPELLIADEPTTALDVTVQAQILALINDLRAELGMSVILITHDLGVVAETADRILVMYAGRIVEEGRTDDVFAHPAHGYTAGLLQALPSVGGAHRAPLAEISGSVPRLDRDIPECVYAPRCRYAAPACSTPLPPRRAITATHTTACIRPDTVFADVKDHEIVRAWI
jgi:peptide/nickel transport system ATP-binding protein